MRADEEIAYETKNPTGSDSAVPWWTEYAVEKDTLNSPGRALVWAVAPPGMNAKQICNSARVAENEVLWRAPRWTEVTNLETPVEANWLYWHGGGYLPVPDAWVGKPAPGGGHRVHRPVLRKKEGLFTEIHAALPTDATPPDWWECMTYAGWCRPPGGQTIRQIGATAWRRPLTTPVAYESGRRTGAGWIYRSPGMLRWMSVPASFAGVAFMSSYPENTLFERPVRAEELIMTEEKKPTTTEPAKRVVTTLGTAYRKSFRASFRRRLVRGANQTLTAALTKALPPKVSEFLETPLGTDVAPFLVPTFGLMALSAAPDTFNPETRGRLEEALVTALETAFDASLEHFGDRLRPMLDAMLATVQE